ncbi:MAG TPA: FKBP-type peptidyl-prolyl cis-trans isomerase [Candidatus Limnocylindrales bacterium]|nr:FKBP-type peptidyl-prolyl cis-trans isomerase [Candidatus Limnocylindrales bacterium]
MNRRTAAPVRSLVLVVAGLVLLTGCWTSSDSGETASTPDPSAPVATSPALPAPEAACPPGSETQDSYECVGVTVTGAKDAEPTIELAEDFAPATELAVADVYLGQGDPVAPGATVTVNYVGVGQASGEIFDSSWQRGEPATFPLDGVIAGWTQGLVGMQPGGRRLLVIPAELAYGDAGAGADIAPGETLVFVVDLIEQTPAA